MISYVRGNLFDSPAQALINTVNTEGVMGKGVALAFKGIYPEMFREYQELCETAELRIGTLHVFRTPRKIIVNFPTKTTWRKPSRLEYIEAGLQCFVRVYETAGIHSIAFPPLGCGNGELQFRDVRPLMEKYLRDLPIPVFLYPPQPAVGLPEHRELSAIKSWLRSEPSVLPFAEVWRDLQAIMAQHSQFRTIGGTEFHAVVRGEPDQSVEIRRGTVVREFPKQDVSAVWTVLRDRHMVTAGAIDPNFANYLFPIFEKLPYVRLIRVADSFNNFEQTPSAALQLTAPHEVQAELAVAG